ncbi:MAG TPA: serine/threonine-protein kinase [Polyangiaceae bacterium]|nr:serine/threonine-protein kinase [Polyangiaceae bacterium]
MAEAANTPLTIGRYALYTEIASGGMASVHFARLLGPGGFSRIVAAKRLLPHMLRDGAFTAMLMDEARLAARIRHPNVVSTLDVVSTDGELVVVMEYVHGEALSRLAQVASDLGEPISLQLATCVIIDALHGLHAAHEVTDEAGQPLGVVHRDISPQNLMVGVDGVTRIADFGIAKAAGRSYETRDGTIKGKLAYMAPEQIERGELTRATDIFAISIVLWELITGRQLFDGKSDAEVMHRVLTYEIPKPSALVDGIPAEYEQVLEKGLSRDPSQRFSTAREMALALEAISTPMRASDIGAWVERIASDTLRRRSHLISKLERSSPTEDAAFAPTRPVTPTPSTTPESPNNTAVNVSLAAGSARRGSSWLPLVALAALVLGVVCALLWMPRGASLTPAAASGAIPNVGMSTVASSGQTPSATSASAERQPAAAGSGPAPAAPSAAASSGGAGSPSGKSGAVRRGKPKASVSCNPPYTVDASGRHLFKLECM